MYLLHIENDSLQNDFSLGLSNKDTAMKHKFEKQILNSIKVHVITRTLAGILFI